MRLLFVVYGMEAGGTQRLVAQLANHFVEAGYLLTLVTFEDPSEQPFFSLSPAVQRVYLRRQASGGGVRRGYRVARWIVGLREAILQSKPDVVVSFIDLTNVMTLLAMLGLKVPCIVSEQADPHHHAIGTVGNILRSLTYRRASKVHVFTDRSAKYFTTIDKSRIAVIPMPVRPAGVFARPDYPNANNRWQIIAVGRLNQQKGFDILISAFAQLADEYRSWDLVVFGDGPSRTDLQTRIDHYALGNRITLSPPVRDIYQQLSQSHLFAFPSRYEGFGLALAEAMAVGLPVVGFEQVAGVEDLIEDGTNGLIARWGSGFNDAVASFADRLSVFMKSTEDRLRFGTAGIRRAQDYEPNRVYQSWNRLLFDLASDVTQRQP